MPGWNWLSVRRFLGEKFSRSSDICFNSLWQQTNLRNFSCIKDLFVQCWNYHICLSLSMCLYCDFACLTGEKGTILKWKHQRPMGYDNLLSGRALLWTRAICVKFAYPEIVTLVLASYIKIYAFVLQVCICICFFGWLHQEDMDHDLETVFDCCVHI